ncbi:DNA repair protein XRCC3 [Scomber scombrus]|uniref:DNA repair protein XRCC3 n=1 Tax=Scomber scombrus TaxID=13677 RepID=A0AAV1QHG5_SCOSC
MEQLELSSRIRAAARRANLSSVGDVLCFSGRDLQRLTGLSRSDIDQLIQAAAAAASRSRPITALILTRGFESGRRLSLGCPVLDRLLGGGLPVGGVTELAGESGAGKTQLGLQLCLSVQYPPHHGGLGSGAVYICTEDRFPSRRLQQLIGQQRLPTDITCLTFTDQIYIEHTADMASLQTCLSRRVPVLLARGLVRLVVVDSVASLFRSEFQASDWLERTRHLLSFSSCLHNLSQEFNTPVLCINQVTTVTTMVTMVTTASQGPHPLSSSVSPALGLAWANQVLVRLMMHRLQGTVTHGDQSSALRRLEVVFAPHLAQDGRHAAVWTEGVRGLEEDA